MKNKLKYLPVLVLACATVWLRLVNLGYSDYVPDEIKALYLPVSGQNLVGFLLQQRKGPIQFFITYLVRFLTPDYRNAFVTRLPFALAGILAVFAFYKLVALHFGRKISFFATFLLAVNGLIIGLSRVVQYQPFLMLFSIGVLYAFSLALADPRWKVAGIYIGMASWTAALLTHFDGIFIAPFALYLLYRWYRQNNDLDISTRLKHMALPAVLSAILLARFYVPWLGSVSSETLDYWQYRFTGETKTLQPSSSIFTFRLYNPLLVLEVYAGLGLLAIGKIKQNWPALAWFLFPWIVLEVLFKEPGTHIYAYVIPATILAGFGLVVLEEIIAYWLGKFAPNPILLQRILFGIFLIGLFGGLFSLSNFIFIDHPPEYPWETKKFLIAKVGGLRDPAYKVWLYGFPYSRHWWEIRDFILAHDPNGYYCTNEDKSLTTFYIPQENDVDRSGYYVYIRNPQDLKESISKDKINYWTAKYPPVKVFMNDGVVVSEIYRMPPGTLAEIQSEGY